MTQPLLFEMAGPTLRCHECGGPLSDTDRLLPHTCERDLACLECCHACHGAALHRIMARESPFPSVCAGRPIKGGRR